MSSDRAIPQLCDDVPGAPRTETQLYRFPPARPCALPAAECTDDDLRRLIGDALGNQSDLFALLGSPDHARRILDLAQRTAAQLTALTAELVGERCEVARRGQLHADLSRQHAEVLLQHWILSAENLALRRRLQIDVTLDVAFDRAARAVTDATELNAELAAETLRFPAQHELFDMSDDTEVVDVPPPGGAS